MFVVNKKRLAVRHFDEYKKQLLTAQQEALKSTWQNLFEADDAH